MTATATKKDELTGPVLITKREAAEMLNCSIRTVERMINLHEWKTVELSRRALRIVKSDVEAFIADQIGN